MAAPSRAPRFSVVLPVYNGERYLAEAIDSVLAQEFRDFELLVWDDASTDGSVRIASSYSDPRIRIFRNHQNLGLFPTLNAGVQVSTGALIRLLGQDDRLKSHCLKAEAAFWSRHPELGMTYCQCDRIDATGVVVDPAGEDVTPELISSSLAAQISFYHGSMPGNISTVVLRREALLEVGSFREDFQVSGDFDMWLRISERFATGFIRRSLLELRAHPDQFSRRSGIGVQFIKEDRLILERLVERLPAEIRPYARRYDRWNRKILYAHYMIRSLLAGDIVTAREVWRELGVHGEGGGALLRWLITANRRWRPLRPRYVHDS